jgi:hypothetical protein
MGLNNLPTLNLTEIGAQCQLGLVVGGDGSMLGIGRQLAPFGVPLIGINQGRLGFITDIALDQYASVLGPMLAGEYDADKRSLIAGKVMRDGKCIFEAMAMNDVVINRGSHSGMVEMRVEVGGHFVANQRADGLIICQRRPVAQPMPCQRADLCCIRRLVAGCWCRLRRIPCRIAPSFCLMQKKWRLKSWRVKMPAPTLTCSHWQSSTLATAL